MAGLNDNHRRILQVAGRHIDEQFSRIEALLENATTAVFPRYVDDLAPTQKRVVRDYLTRIRVQLLDLLRRFGMTPEPAETHTSWAARLNLIYLQETVSDLDPERLEGYGALDPDTREALRVALAEVDQTITRAIAYLGQQQGRDPQERLRRLEAAGRLDLGAIQTLERIIGDHGLVEFRPTLASILDHLENDRLEIAIFGRVSSGKSSLLNQIIGTPVLPVGVTPVTAVPTRITAGSAPECVVSFAEGAPRKIPLEELPAFASEAGNPGNTRHVTALRVRLPSPRLREGIVFIDTPGIGSLATQGQAEAIAYLPRCDLGVVLLDSAAALNHEDLGLLRLLYEAGIPAMVLLSKCDLLAAEDRARVVRYIAEQMERQAGLSLPVYPVSTVGPEAALLEEWFEREIRPLYAQQQSLIQASVRRKSRLLLEGVRAALTARLAATRSAGTRPAQRRGPEDLEAVEQALRDASQALREAEERARSVREEVFAEEEGLLAELAAISAEHQRRNGQHPVPSESDLDDRVMQALDRPARALVAEIHALRDRLGAALAVLREAVAPGAPSDETLPPDLSGLPVPDLAPLRAAFREQAPAPAAWGLAWFRGAAERRVREAWRPALHEAVALHARRLQDWTLAAVKRLAQAYQDQEAVYREALREPSLRTTSEGAETRGALERDLRELDQLIAEQEQGAGEATPAAQPATSTATR
jgi:GTP-binding protein EngB required for normal cell division